VEVWFVTMRERQRQVQLYRGQVPSPGRPTVAWREDRVRYWAAIGRGASSEEAACEIGVSPAVGTRWFRQAGGVAPNLPPAVSGRFLSFAEREDIAIWRAQKAGVREIARRLGRAPSTISRELRRNASTRTWRLDYRASVAQWHAERRARRPKVSKLAADDRLREYVQDRLGGGPPGTIPAASAAAAYFLTVLRSTPSDCAISLLLRPACQWTRISMMSTTSNVLLAIGPPAPVTGLGGMLLLA
jgi:transposase, IS30 family